MTSGVRRGTLSDVRALVRLHGQSSTSTIQARFLSPLPVLSTRMARRLLCPPGGFSLVAERQGYLAGIITVESEAEGARVRGVLGLWVADAWQRQGIGTELLLEAVRASTRAAIAELVLSVSLDNRAVLPMVSSAGLRARVTTQDGRTQVVVRLVPEPTDRRGYPSRQRPGLSAQPNGA